MSQSPKLTGITMHFDNFTSAHISGGTNTVTLNKDCHYADLLAAEAQGKLIDYELRITIRERERP